MNYTGTIIRPPSEAESIILQVTLGCSHNSCTFCGAYMDKKYRIKNNNTIMQDISYASHYYRNTRRLFLCDGDALSMPFEILLDVLIHIEKQLPWIRRVGIYANAKGLENKSVEELRELKKHGLGIIYMGLESGDDTVLKKVNKGVTAATQIEQSLKVKAAGIMLSLTVLLGLAGSEGSHIHAEKTGKALSEIRPNHTGALTLMLIPETPLERDAACGKFKLLSPQEILEELIIMITHTNMPRGIFSANHASNYIPLQIRFPDGKNAALKILNDALHKKSMLKPEWMRGL